MHEQLLTLLEELSLRSCSEDENCSKEAGQNYFSSTQTSNSNVSSPTYDQLTSNIPEEDLELKNAVKSLFQDLKPTNQTPNFDSDNHDEYRKSKLLVALLGNVDLVTCAVKKINQLVSIGKRMEQIYRLYYVDQDTNLDLEEISRLISTFSDIYNSESYVRQVNVSKLYHAYCNKLIDIYNSRTASQLNDDDVMISQ